MEPVAIVGVSAILPDAPDAVTFWANVTGGRYSISEVHPSRWDPALYFDEDHSAPDKTYSKIGGWVREWEWDPLAWKLPIPPKVSEAIDDGQKWAIACTRAVLADHGRPIDHERTAVILGNAMAGEHHYQTALRIATPEIVRELHSSPSFQQLPAEMRASITEELGIRMSLSYPEVTEDTMAGELGNVMAGRVANLFDFHGPNFIVDAACASAMAAIDASIEGLVEHEFDTVVTGGIDRNMGASSFVKFCKIGALSATGTRPFDAGADGFVMGEGAALFLLKRLADAERDGDRVYAVLRGIAGASDGKGKGITAPNPVGQRLAVARAWSAAGLSPSVCGLMEAHGTSTRVGDVVEVTSLGDVFASAGLALGSVALGSAKSNIGHLKAAAGAAGILKATLALHHKVLPPSLNFADPNPNIDWSTSPFRVNTELRDWAQPRGGVRTAGVSAFGFGGTNFHVVLEEHVPGRLRVDAPKLVAVGADLASPPAGPSAAASPDAGLPDAGSRAVTPPKAPLRGALVLGAATVAGLIEQLRAVQSAASAGTAPEPQQPSVAELSAPERLAIDYGDAAELADKATRALAAFETPAMWTMLRGRGVFRGSGPAAPIAFMYTGQGSQYVNMLSQLRAVEPIVAERFVEADRVMTPLLGKPLTDYIFVDTDDAAAVEGAEEDLRNTEITQPAVLATDLALTALLTAYGMEPDMVIGHSLGEYGALVAAGALSFPAALEAVSARGHEMASLTVEDTGVMAAVFAPVDEVQRLVEGIDGNVVLANVNSNAQSVIGGATVAVETALAACAERGWLTARLTVSHAFHTSIVAAASEPLRRTLERLELHPPARPIVSNVTGQFYPMGTDVTEPMLDLLAKQVASPVQFVQGLHTLYDAGARVFVEVGPKRALHGFASDVLGDDVAVLFTNHPKLTDVAAFNHALCGLYAAGHGATRDSAPHAAAAAVRSATTVTAPVTPISTDSTKVSSAVQSDLGALFDDFLDKARSLMGVVDGASRTSSEPVVITGAALGTPGTQRVFDDENLARLLHGEQLIDVIPARLRKEILDKHIVRLTKSETRGASFEAIDSVADVIKLAGRAGSFDLSAEFGVEAERLAAFGRTTQLAVAAGIDALRDAGIPIVQRYKTTHLGTQLPERWGLADAVRDETGVIFASAFPGLEELADEVRRYEQDSARRLELDELQAVRARVAEADAHSAALVEIDRRIHDVQRELEVHPYLFDRRFLFRVLSMGHSQFAELIGARGPNTQINSACASTTQAISLAEDWIRAGRCRRVIVVAADDATSDDLLGWLGAGFLATGAAATDEDVTEAALPFDKRRHGMILGMGAAALVVESAEAARERGVQPICEVLGTVTANSAFHGTRLDVEHIGGVMEAVVRQAEARGADRAALAGELVFVSHETYTPARGGSAAAEIRALRQVFGANADRIVIANTKGVTGHPMGVGLEDVVAVKALETGIVPPVANFREVDPELGVLNLSRGGSYPVRYALRLAAGFGSQISMVLLRWTPMADGRHRAPDELGYSYRITDRARWSAWLRRISGQDAPETEVVQRRLRIVDTGPGATASSATVVASVAPPVVVPVAPPAAAVPVVAATMIEQPAAVVAVVAPVPVAPVVEPSVVVDEVSSTILRLVAEQTGYPPEMLDLDLDLEADLGVDTVKQAELFAAVREAYGIERDDKLKLRDYPTLAHVIGFVHERAPQTAVASAVPVPAAATVVASAPVAVAASVGVDEVSATILRLVAEQTGYPPEMLDLDLDLEADLGVDTVKQAELFAAVREAYGIERDDKLKLRDYPTLAHVIGFVHERAPQTAVASVAPAAPAVVASAPVAVEPSVRVDEVSATILRLVAEQTGYPPEMLDLDLDLEADLGVDTVKQAELFAAVREAYGIERDDKLKLRDYPTLAHVIGFVHERAPQTAVAPEPATVAPAAAVAPVVEPSVGVDEVSATILRLVAEQTGYPPEMLDLDLDLEADLGVDTVKQAELFAAVREAYGIERDDKLKLRDYPTLAHVIGFVHERAPQTAVAPEPATADEVAATVEPDAADAARFPRRVPVPVLRPALELCETTGVVLAAGDRVIVVADAGGVAAALTAALHELGVDVLSADGPLARDGWEATVQEWRAAGPISGVFWLPALDQVDVATLDPSSWSEGLHLRVKLLASAMRVLYDDMTAGHFLISGVRLGGCFGYDAAGAQDVLGGATSGFTKAFARERVDALVKVVDFPSAASAGEVASQLLAEVARDPGAVEVGHADGLRWGIGVAERDIVEDPTRVLGPTDVLVVTGAAGSIVSAITTDLAVASRGTFHLIDLTPEPKADDPDLERFVHDHEGLKVEIAHRITERGDRATPALVERELARLERSRAALDAMQAVQRAGGTVHWYQADLTDAAAVQAVVRQIVERSGRVDVLLHCAGLEISRFLPDKTDREYDLVFDVKSNGWFHLLHALGDTPLGAAVVFSSIAGRFGNGGQTDYSAANDLLCKSVSSFRTSRPTTRGVAIDWTAWAGIGMASRGSIPKMMAMAGIDMLPPEIGIPVVRHELTATGAGGEVVVAGSLGIMLEETTTGGLDVAAATAALAGGQPGPMLGDPIACTLADGLVVRTTLTTEQPFLDNHRIDGTPVLPGVMGIEAFAETAAALAPGWEVHSLRDVAFLAPFKLYRDEPRVAEIRARLVRGDDGTLVAECQLIGRRTLPAQGEQSTVHFTGTVVLAKAGQQRPSVGAPAATAKKPPVSAATADSIYEIYFHGPAYQVLAQAWAEGGLVVGSTPANLPANQLPADRPLLAWPRLVELCFQTAGVHELGTTGSMALPARVGRVDIIRPASGGTGSIGAARAIVTRTPDGDDAVVVDSKGKVVLHLVGYTTTVLPGGPDDALLQPLRAAMVAGTDTKPNSRRGKS